MYVFPYNPEWKHIYKAEAEKIRSGVGIDIELHHIGSTSIKGLAAKNCIDILGVIENFESGLELVKPLESFGYIYKGEYGIANRHYFSKPLNHKTHLHICPKGHEQIKRHLHFINVMKNSDCLIQELNEIKINLANKFPKEIYQIRKKTYYEEILKTRL